MEKLKSLTRSDILSLVLVVAAVIALATLCSSDKKDEPDYETKCRAFCRTVDAKVLFCNETKKVVICE